MKEYYDIETTNIEQDELIIKSKKQGALKELKKQKVNFEIELPKLIYDKLSKNLIKFSIEKYRNKLERRIKELEDGGENT